MKGKSNRSCGKRSALAPEDQALFLEAMSGVKPLESRERAQNAARQAAETRARVRSEVERSMAEVASLLAQANARVTAAQKSRTARRTLREAQQLLARVNDDVQKAGAAMKAEDYAAAQPVLMVVRERLGRVMYLLDQPQASQSSRRRAS